MGDILHNFDLIVKERDSLAAACDLLHSELDEKSAALSSLRKELALLKSENKMIRAAKNLPKQQVPSQTPEAPSKDCSGTSDGAKIPVHISNRMSYSVPPPPSYSSMFRTNKSPTEHTETVLIGTSLLEDTALNLNKLGSKVTCFMYRGADLIRLRNRLEVILPAEVYREKKFRIMLQGGGNDSDGLTSEDVIARYRKLIDAIRHLYPHAEIITSRIPLRESKRTRDHNEEVKKTIEQVNSYLETRSTMRGDTKYVDACPKSWDFFKEDLIHFNTLGKKLFAEKLHAFLCPADRSEDIQMCAISREKRCADHLESLTRPQPVDFHRVPSRGLT